jgi:hypothetical protein
MGRMRFARLLLALGVVFAPPALADEPDLRALAGVAAKVQPVQDRWECCLARSVQPQSPGTRAPAAVAERALAACREEEARLRRALVREVGRQEATGVMAQLVTSQRRALVAAIAELRARRP